MIINVDYDNCITNLTSSIQKYYNLKPNYKTNPLVDSLLNEKHYKNVIVFVFDAMGNSIIDKNTTSEHFLQKHRIGKMTSTFPPTTANCTTSYISGLNPITTGWLGWATYYKDLNLVVDNFPNCNSLTKEEIIGDNIARRKLSDYSLGKDIESKTNVKYYSLWPKFIKGGCKSLDELVRRLAKICNQDGDKYIYVYWDDPDKTMHMEGTSNDHIKKILNRIGKSLHYIERTTKDTIGFVSADHSMIDVTPIALYTYYDIMSCLEAPFSCDSRTPFFFVKDGKKELFKDLFLKNFGNDFYLYSKDEVINMNLFGYGDEHPLFKEIIGDYVAIAKSNYYFLLAPNSHIFKGHHAGGCLEEASIPLICIKN